MAQQTRQAKLFAAEDYTVVYDSFINADLQAYDYDTIRTSMVNYVRNTYPENYNDWIESAEFVALLDVVAQFGHNLAFRVDLNTRNNFLSTAERQESIFKLSEFLGYQPKRNVPAFGNMKVVSVKTNEAVIGSAGTSLGGKDIRFESTSNVNNFDDFVAVINSVMQASNNFGSPQVQTTLENITHQFYNLNNTVDQIKFNMSGSANGRSSTFNAISLSYDAASDAVVESTPDRNSSFGIVYKNDGKGLGSTDTGFFFGVKQGDLQFKDFTIENTLDSLKLDVDVDNVNQTDVWVSTIDDNKDIVTNWTKVENVYGQNEIYNALPATERNIFSVKTRENNQVSVCFSDRSFGNLPKGKIRVWYRTSANATYTLRSEDLGLQKITINYTGIDGNVYNAVFGLQIKSPIRNASISESLSSIKENAPRNYSAQNRMVTASDYNNVIKTYSESALKTKSINRTHSGHSRYINNTDPTGAYSSLTVYNTDGVLFGYDSLSSATTATNSSSQQIFNKHIKNIIDNEELVNLYYTKFSQAFSNLKPVSYPDFSQQGWPPSVLESFQWQVQSTAAAGSNNGYLTKQSTEGTAIVGVGSTQTTYTKYIEVGSLVEFATPVYNESNQVIDKTLKWAKVVNVVNNGLGVINTAGDPTGLVSSGTGSIVLDANIPDNSYVSNIYPALNRVFSSTEQQIILKMLSASKTFAIYYNIETTSWEIFEPSASASFNDDQPANFNTNSNEDRSWLVWFDYQSGAYDIYTRSLKLEFSSNNVEFSNITNEYNLNTYTLKNSKDVISLLSNDLIEECKFFISGYYTDSNGVSDSSRVIVSLEDANNDKRPNNPNAFTNYVAGNTIQYDWDNDGIQNSVIGKENIKFEWKHNPAGNVLVDPSFTNVIDVFVLNSAYDRDYKQFLLGKQAKPLAPTSYQLSTMFGNITDKKAMSDTVVYRSVTYKSLFGTTAESQLKARFRVIKMNGSKVTDNDVKSKVIETINEYFNVNNWDFGETFYFTELAAYVHKELSGIISSFVIVPLGNDSVFGDLFEITPSSSEMFIPDVRIEDVDIIDAITDANIRAGQ